jgi:WYL domain
MNGKTSWSARQRLEFIEFRLFWDGEINRQEIVDRFGISIPQASADVGAYRTLAPENIEYSTTKKRYVATQNFEARLIAPNAERYLAQLRAISDGVITTLDTFMETTPDVVAMPIPSRLVDPPTLRALLRAIKSQRSMRIEYQSLNANRPEPMWREITPHAFGWDGLRWHVRAFCHLELIFKDFIISRFLKVGQEGPPAKSGSDDRDWNTDFEVVLVPNPQLSADQKQTIERDYGMSDGRAVVRVRRAMLYYFDKRLRLDVAEKQDRPRETPVIVQNRNAYDRELKAVSY